MTEWRTIPRNPKYEVSSDGQVRNSKTGRVLRSTGDRYLMVSLGYDIRALVHRLVAEAFCPQPAGAHQVNHKNGNRYDNRAENLEWVTASENNLHSRRVLRKCVGEAHGLSRLTWAQVQSIRDRAAIGTTALAAEFGVSDTTIRSIIDGKTWRVREARLSA